MRYSELQAWLYDANGFCKHHALEYWSKCATKDYIPSSLSAEDQALFEPNQLSDCVFIAACLSKNVLALKPPYGYNYFDFYEVHQSMIERGLHQKFIDHIETDIGYNTAVTREYLKELLEPILDVDTFDLDKNQFIGYICFYELCERYYKDNNL
jgi:hypothetical protein